LTEVLNDFGEVLSDIPSKTELTQMEIDTGDFMPINQVLYRLSESIKDLRWNSYWQGALFRSL